MAFPEVMGLPIINEENIATPKTSINSERFVRVTDCIMDIACPLISISNKKLREYQENASTELRERSIKWIRRGMIVVGVPASLMLSTNPAFAAVSLGASTGILAKDIYQGYKDQKEEQL